MVNFGAFGFASWVYENIGWAKEGAGVRTTQ
jgi:hypothetical protein